MRNIQATGKLYDKVITINQVSKAKAKKLFAAGKEIYLQSSNMHPFGVWQSVCPIKLDDEQLQADIKSNQSHIAMIERYIEQYTNKPEEWADKAKVIELTAKVINSNTQFDSICNEYRCYNCDKERGNYVTFYAKHEDI